MPAAGKDPQRPIEEKESHRWLQAYADAANIAALFPDTRVISVTDREGDIARLTKLLASQPPSSYSVAASERHRRLNF